MTRVAFALAFAGSVAVGSLVPGYAMAASPPLPVVSPKANLPKVQPVAQKPAPAPMSYAEELVGRAEALLGPNTSSDDHATAARLLQEAVSAGNIDARILLADLLWRGDGVTQSSSEAEKLLLDALTEDRSGRASYALGEMYSNHDSYLYDPAKARIMYLASSNHGYAVAMVRLARILMADAPTSKSGGEAKRLLEEARDHGQESAASEALGDYYLMNAPWKAGPDAIAAYQHAADLGNVAAELKLAATLLEGVDVEPDQARGKKILAKAILAPSNAAPTALWIRIGDLLLSEKDGAYRDPKQAAAAYDKAAYEGDENGMVRLARLLMSGKGVAEDPERTKALLERAMEKGALADGGLALGDLLGRDGPLSDYPKAAAAYEASAKAGNAEAMLKLAHFYDAGLGVTASRDMAVTFATQAMKAGLWAPASEELGDIYVHFGQQADHQAAVDAYGRAADAGRTTAMLKLARMLGEGSGPADAPRARDLAMRAVAAGDPVGGWSALGDIYGNPATPLFDPAKAGEAYGKAADLGDAFSMLKLANMLSDGKSLPVDLKQAVQLYQGAVAAGEVAAGSERLGDLFLAASAPVGDRKKAVSFLEAAAKAGSGSAHLKLFRLEASANPPKQATWAEIATHVREAARILGPSVPAVEVMNLQSKATVAITQQLLRDAGFSTPVTGTFRDSTSASIKAFCSARKIDRCETAFVTLELLNALTVANHEAT